MIEVKSSQLADMERSFFLHLASEDGMVQTSNFQLKIIVKTAVFETNCKTIESLKVN